ncbi:MAG: carbohydrate porin [Drouetiella hepatica Uher 2000/2452]|jgi:hypothetical protein|uniref:Carbohydrate porin n=1 Tax=Drouetiella hepatica Uher 2000/2452 TaxID=904376 RepID=A0A951UM04_9CYAN|nr:carbohydrate porin [Drouetiella hepatica Uher 2000/2452]
MHRQAGAKSRIFHSNQHTQLSSLILAGILSTVLAIGIDCGLKVQAAQAEVLENGDRPVPTPSSNQSLDQSDNPSLESTKVDIQLGIQPSIQPSIQQGIQPLLDVAELSHLTRSQTLKASTVKLPPIHLTAPIDSTAAVAGAAAEPSASNMVLEFSSAIALNSTAPVSSTPAQASTEHDPDIQYLADTRDANATEETQGNLLGTPLVHIQSAYILQDGQSSGRLRASGVYAVTPNLLFGTTIDLVTGDGFSDSSDDVNLDLNELYFTLSPARLSNLRFTAGMIDLTSYFDRNSFAKDSVTHFFNPVFQTNPALAATGIGSRPGALLNWDVTDALNLKAAAFSSSRDLGDFAIDGFAGEIGLRLGNVVVRGTYANDRDAGQRDGFQEIFQFSRGNSQFGLRSGDREEAFGINAEVFIPELNLGLFGRYGHYENQELDRGGDTYSFGVNLLDLFLPDDRLGLGYGRELSNDALRQDRGDKIPDVLEVFYDFRVSPNFRAGATFQQRDGFSDTVLGIRLRADFDIR